MRSIDDYLDAAKQRQGVSSDTKLGKLIGVSSPVMSGMRTRRNWPSDPTMVRIAELAGVDPAEALIDLSIWRNGSHGKVQLVWAELKKKLTPIAAMLCLFMGLSAALPPPAKAAAPGADMVKSNLYLMEIISPRPAGAASPWNRYRVKTRLSLTKRHGQRTGPPQPFVRCHIVGYVPQHRRKLPPLFNA